MKPVGKLARAFGSFGWGKGGAEDVHKYLEEMKCDIIGDPIKNQFIPHEDALKVCEEAGREMGEKAIALAEVRSRD